MVRLAKQTRRVTFTTLKKNEINSVSLEAALRVSGRGTGIFPNPNSLIRRIPIRAGPGKQEQVVVRSPLAVARVGVQLTRPERVWLCKALMSMSLGTGAGMKHGSHL